MFKLVNGGDRLPTRATKFSAGFDVYSREDKTIGAGCTELIGLGIAIDQDVMNISGMLDKAKVSMMSSVADYKRAHYLELHIRSSLRVKGLTSLGTGVIDIDYRDEIKMVVHFPKPKENWIEAYTINKGDKIGQLILKRHEGYLIPQEYTLDAERSGGFGSTGQ